MKNEIEYPNGFTLIETLVVIGIMLVIVSMGVFVSMEEYRGHSLRSERDGLVAILQRARAESLHNMNQSSHGVHIADSSYVLFEGSDWQHRSLSQDAVFTTGNVQLSGGGDVVFGQLDGSLATTSIITLNATGQKVSVSVGSSGQIDW